MKEAITPIAYPAGLVSRLGPPGMPSLTEAALQTLAHRPELPQALLHQAYAVDQQAVKLLTQRQQGVLAGVAGLQAYSAALRLVLPDKYADSSHHSRWAQAIAAAVDASDTQVQPVLIPLCHSVVISGKGLFLLSHYKTQGEGKA